MYKIAILPLPHHGSDRCRAHIYNPFPNMNTLGSGLASSSVVVVGGGAFDLRGMETSDRTVGTDSVILSQLFLLGAIITLNYSY
jgi:hypothetical protein